MPPTHPSLQLPPSFRLDSGDEEEDAEQAITGESSLLHFASFFLMVNVNLSFL